MSNFVFNSEFLAECDSNNNNCISVGEARECLPETLLDMILGEYQDLGEDFEACADHIEDILAEYGNVIHDFVSNLPSR